ncbi:MAG: site-specific DNA-methyltransferase [Candidatus Paceibacterota bacterium]
MGDATVERIEAGDGLSESADIVEANLEAMRGLFPEAFSEDGIDFDVLSQLLGDEIADGDEKYGLNWHGKKLARRIALTPSMGTLRPCPEESVDWDTTQNLMIEGDNLEVLKLLQKSYSGKVKLIYIDPPYNTGKDFVYKDNYRDNIKNYLELTGQTDEEGKKSSTNVESSGRFHTDWLNMMYPRLKLARNLLREDGVIFISVGPQEFANVVAVVVEIFGEENLLGQITRVAKTTSNKGTHFAPSIDYLLVAARNADEVDGFSVAPGKAYEEGFKGTDQDGRRYKEVGLYQASLDPMRGCTNQRYWIECPDGSLAIPPGNVFPPENTELSKVPPQSRDDKVWRWADSSFPTRRSEIVFKETARSPLVTPSGSSSKWNVYVKQYLDRRLNEGVLPRDYLNQYPNSQGTKELKQLDLRDEFDFAKPVGLVQWCFELACEEGIVMDFFAGSGTTGQAVFESAADGSDDLRFVLVQLPERVSDDIDSGTVSDVTKERLRRAGAKVKVDHPEWDGDVGFRVFKLDTSNIRAWSPDRDEVEASLLDYQEHLANDRSEDDILYEVLLKLGLDLCVPIEERDIGGVVVSSVGGGVLMTCLAASIPVNTIEALGTGIVDWLDKLKPAGDTTVIFRDSAFGNDVAKTNIAAILNQAVVVSVRSI